MKNQVQAGHAIYVTAPSGGFTSGNGYQVGASIFGVAGFDAAVGVMGVLWVVGVYNLTKESAQAWSQGDEIFWDNGNQWCTNVQGSGMLKIGKAWAAAANPSAVGMVRLTDAG